LGDHSFPPPDLFYHNSNLKNEFEATISPDAIAKADTYIVTLKREGEAFSESHRAHLVVGFKQ
jgi:hypothetical protein